MPLPVGLVGRVGPDPEGHRFRAEILCVFTPPPMTGHSGPWQDSGLHRVLGGLGQEDAKSVPLLPDPTGRLGALSRLVC